MENSVKEMKFQKQELTPNQVLSAQRDLQAMKDLDKIKMPIEARIYNTLNNNQFTYRNDSYREMVAKMDIEAKAGLEKLILNNTKK